MNPLALDIPTIAITGSSGKSTTREFIASIMKLRWKVLKTTGNKNLPLHTKELIASYDPSIQAIVMELGMGKQGAGERHCKHIQPNISIITNIGTAHYGNLGNDIESTAKFKSVLIKKMKQDGMLLINEDDKNSKLLDTADFKGEIIKIGIRNSADYQATNIIHQDDGLTFQVTLNNVNESFFIPTFGTHNIYNALFSVALCHRLNFTPEEIRLGLKNYQVPIKRLNFINLYNQSIMIDDTVNANPDSVKAAVDVLVERGKDKTKIVVLGGMLELGEYSIEGHKEVGRYLASKKVDKIYTFGPEAKLIGTAAIEAGYPAAKVRHFEKRDNLHRVLKSCIKPDTIILIKGSSATEMYETVKYIKNRFMYTILIDGNLNQNFIYMSSQTLNQMNINSNNIILNFGAFKKIYGISIDDTLEPGKIIIPQKLTNKIMVPDLPYDYYIDENQLFLGPVIGILVYPRYIQDPTQQLLRFSNYDKIKGLIFLFRPHRISMTTQTINGFYYNPATKEFISGTFPYPNVIFNRIPLNEKLYNHLKKKIGDNVFNYPYINTNKLEFWNQLSKQSAIATHLPITQAYRGVNSLLEALDKFKSAYLKPTSLSGGKGVFQVRKTNSGYVLTDKYTNDFLLKKPHELKLALKEKLEQDKFYIIQQEIPFFNKDGNKMDFRVYIQKTYSKRWKFSGLETKVAKTGSIISNSKNREKIIPGETALKEIYGLDENTIKQKINEITQLCFKVLKNIELTGGHLGDAAVDIIIDKNLKIWLLEVQLNYAAEIKAKRTEDEQQILPYILPTPLEYAKALSKF